MINLAKDSTIRGIASKNEIEHRIYCHVRHNGPNKVVEDLAVRKRLRVEIVDSSHLAVELLKSRPQDQPVRVAKLSSTFPTMVERPLNCLIIGFGEVGRDSFRFLYEFGTFIQMKEGEPHEANPRIIVVDKKMNELSGLFRINTPALRFDSHGGPLVLKNLDYNSYGFYRSCLSEYHCKNLNYIVLALGDDDQNIALAANIFNLIRRYREDMSDLIIMVRCVKEEKYEILKKVADHYNRGSGEEKEKIRLFGNPKDIYSYDIIIRDELTRKGKTFYANYERLRKDDDDWSRRRNRLTEVELMENGELGYPHIDQLRKLRRQESQDLANALHSATKMWLLQESLGKEYDWHDFLLRYFEYDGSSTMKGQYADISYPHLSSEENKIIRNLAMLEHARWNAAHVLQGYKPDNSDRHKCNERTQMHNCLKRWQELDKESRDAKQDFKAYDYSVIDTSLALYKEELELNTLDDDRQGDNTGIDRSR